MQFDPISSRIHSVFQPYFWSKGVLRGHFLLKKNVYSPISIPGFLAGVALGGGGGGWVCFPFPNSSVKLDYSNFGQDVLWEKMNIL